MKDKKILCTVCARGGSKGLPNKNLLEIDGKSLIGHTLTQAKSVNGINAVIVSSDSKKILEEGKNFEADILLERDAELASDNAGKIDAIIDCINYAERKMKVDFDYVIDLDVTSPLRSIDDITNCLKMSQGANFTNLITVTDSRKNPYFNQIEITNEGPQLVKTGYDIKGRQAAPKVYDMNASIYVWEKKFLLSKKSLFSKHTIVYDMPEERSIDIDSELDFKFVKYLMENEL
jgi:CMP-N-acetylneuraminic acid synthetase